MVNPADRNPDSTPAGEPRRLLRCDVCGRVVGCPPEELLRYTREGWPRCCGQVVALFIESDRPQAPPASL